MKTSKIICYIDYFYYGKTDIVHGLHNHWLLLSK